MSDASELLRDAQYALQNVSHGSTDSKKFAAEAKSLAHKIMRKHPGTQEAAGAQLILEQLGERLAEPALEIQHIHKTAAEQHQSLTHAEPTDDGAPASPLAGWGLRLLQAIPVVIGAFLLVNGIEAFSSNASALALQLLVAGTVLINFPRTSLFARLLSVVRSRVFLPNDGYATADHLPDAEEIRDFLRALVQGKKSKIAVIATILFLLNDVLLVVAAILYVIGLRLVLQDMKKWLLD